MSELDKRYLEGIRLFNAQEFFECHDVLEDLWNDILGPDRDFYQGLIHVAVALFHFESSNLGGARKMYGSACVYLSGYSPSHLGLNVEKLLGDFETCFAELLAATTYPTGLAIDRERIPRIDLNA